MKFESIFGLALLLSSSCHAAIVYPQAPKGGRQIAYEKVAELLRSSPNVFQGPQIKDLTITNSHQMYSVGAKEVISGNLLSGAKTGGWRFLVWDGTNLVGEVPLGLNPQDGSLLKAGGIGVRDNGLKEALQKAGELPQVKEQDYELRSLAIDLWFRAVWLHGNTNDILLPLPPTYGQWNAYQPYDENQRLKLLKPEVEKTRKA